MNLKDVLLLWSVCHIVLFKILLSADLTIDCTESSEVLTTQHVGDVVTFVTFVM